ncbi:MAG TPA: hypothetical protein VEU96_08755, partial [Bryobacteraceae bacterium]|nr:hypothetical protein [Bryobacteraceae bacterium]
AIGAKPPMHIPAWVARIAAGPLAVVMFTESRGASNQKAKALLGWKIEWPSWRSGFREALGKGAPKTSSYSQPQSVTASSHR